MRTMVSLAMASMLLVSLPASADLELARKSGCLACHSVDKKVVGPAWTDVARHYGKSESAKNDLFISVSRGSRGKWSGVTGGTPMPPNSPRVADADIVKLVEFILRLGDAPSTASTSPSAPTLWETTRSPKLVPGLSSTTGKNAKQLLGTK